MDQQQAEVIEKTVTKGDETKTIRCEKVENGFIISITKYGKDMDHECKKFISKTNPLAEKEEDEEKSGGIMDSVKSLLSEMGEVI